MSDEKQQQAALMQIAALNKQAPFGNPSETLTQRYVTGRFG